MSASFLHWYAAHATAIFAVLIPLMIVIDKLRERRAGHRIDALDTASSLMSGTAFLVAKTLVGKLVFVTLATVLYEQYRLATLDMLNPLVWIGVFLVRDLLYYWVHRLEHRVRCLWASHQIHHSPETIGAATAIRVPWMEALYKPWFSLWLPLVGFDPVMAVAFDVFAASVGVLQHTTCFTRRTIADWLFVTPSTHRVHHGSNPEYIDKNFGALLVVWDRLFGTYEPEVAPVVYGIGTKKLDTPAKVMLGGFPEIVTNLRRPTSFSAKLNYLVSAPGS